MLSSARTLEILLQRNAEEEKLQISRLLMQRQLRYLGGIEQQVTPVSNPLSLASLRRSAPRQMTSLTQSSPTSPAAATTTSTSVSTGILPSSELTDLTTRSISSSSSHTSSEENHETEEERPLGMNYLLSKDDDDTFFNKHTDTRETLSKPEAFPFKIYRMLHECEKKGGDHIVSWTSTGNSFTIYDNDKFVEQIMPRYFTSNRMTSFQRQLNLYGFRRSLRGQEKGSYYHKDFAKGQRNRCLGIKRKIQKFKIPPHFLSENPTPSFQGNGASVVATTKRAKTHPVPPLQRTALPPVPSQPYNSLSILSVNAMLASASYTSLWKQQLALSRLNQLGPRW